MSDREKMCGLGIGQTAGGEGMTVRQLCWSVATIFVSTAIVIAIVELQ